MEKNFFFTLVIIIILKNELDHELLRSYGPISTRILNTFILNSFHGIYASTNIGLKSINPLENKFKNKVFSFFFLSIN